MWVCHLEDQGDKRRAVTKDQLRDAKGGGDEILKHPQERGEVKQGKFYEKRKSIRLSSSGGKGRKEGKTAAALCFDPSPEKRILFSLIFLLVERKNPQGNPEERAEPTWPSPRKGKGGEMSSVRAPAIKLFERL